MKDGEHIGYYSSGLISSVRNYLGGELHGEYINYFTSGNIIFKYSYLEGKKHGEFIDYYSSGEISYKFYYINDNLVTELEWLCYNRNLKLDLLGL